MKKTLIFFVFIIAGCVTPSTLLTPTEQYGIPKGATKVIANTKMEGENLYKQVYMTLVEDGFRIDESNKEMGYLSTQGKEIEQETMIQLSVVLRDSLAIFTGQWDLTASAKAGMSAGFGVHNTTGWSTAKWGESGRPELSFAYMYKLAEKFGNLSFE